ncbi:MAG: hypothetical protein LQ340_003249, partial [Diploschistes diacapsis]
MFVFLLLLFPPTIAFKIIVALSTQQANAHQDSYEDQFAQTREPDNLFDDDITPITEPVSQPVPSRIPPEAPRAQTSTHDNRPRNADARGPFRGRVRATHPGHIRPPRDNPAAAAAAQQGAKSGPATSHANATEPPTPQPPFDPTP